jgi:cobalt-zinc-cadmium efflux system outer membrane protein
MTRRWVLAVGLSMSLPHMAAAQALQAGAAAADRYLDPVAGLTLEDALSQAREHEPGLRGVRAQVDVAQGQRTQAGLRPNPSVLFAEQQQPGGTDSQTRIEVQWPLDLARRSARIHAAAAAVDASTLAVAARERELAGMVRQAFGEAAAAVQDLAVADAVLGIALEQQRLVTARVDQGAAPPVEQAVVTVDVLELRAAAVAAAGRVERSLVGLGRLLGLPAATPIKLRAPLEELVRGDSVSSPPSIDRRPDILEAQAAVTTADAEIARVRAESRPDVSLTGMYMRMDAGFPQQGFAPSGVVEPIRGVFHYVSAGAMVTVPLLNRNQGTIAAAEAMRMKAASALDTARATADAEITSARTRNEHARAALDILDPARAVARQNVSVMQQSYQLGRATLVEVLEQQRRFIEFERQYSAALSEAYAAGQELIHASGDIR